MKKLLFIFLLFPSLAFADVEILNGIETLSSFDEKNISVQNDNMKLMNNNVNKINTVLSERFVGSILSTEFGGTGKDFSAASTDSLVYFSSTGVMSAALVNAVIPGVLKLQLFTSSSTFTAPAGISKVYLSMIGGGGGSGGGSDGAGGGGGGASGAYILSRPFTVVAGNAYTVTVGAGGTAGARGIGAAATAGGNGGTTSFDVIAATGGGGGQGGNVANGAGVGGTVTGGFSPSGLTGGGYTFTGTAGAAKTGNSGGGGAGSPFGVGATAVSNTVGVSPAANTGAGAAGGTGDVSGSVSANGATGGSGIVIVMY